MSKRTIFTTITPLPAGVSRETTLETLHDHLEMIDLNPAHSERHPIPSPPESTAEEYHCSWYSITDKISYLPGISGSISFKACFHDLNMGVQIHVYAPAGLEIKEKWTIGGNAENEPVQPAEIGIGAPVSGLYLREDVEIRCNIFMTRFVKKQLKDACKTLVARLLVKAQLQEAAEKNKRLTSGSFPTQIAYAPSSQASFSPPPSAASFSPPNSPPLQQSEMAMRANARPLGSPPLSPPYTGTFPPQNQYSYEHLVPQPLECPPRWEEQRSHIVGKPERASTGSYAMYDDKPGQYVARRESAYAELEANQKGPVELP